MDSDRILVMDKGQIAEFDSPRALLDSKNSYFSKLVAETGKATSEYLHKIARGELEVIAKQ